MAKIYNMGGSTNRKNKQTNKKQTSNLPKNKHLQQIIIKGTLSKITEKL